MTRIKTFFKFFSHVVIGRGVGEVVKLLLTQVLLAGALGLSLRVVLVMIVAGRKVYSVLFLPFHASILVPGFDLQLSEAKLSR